jgi:hypothetical protein
VTVSLTTVDVSSFTTDAKFRTWGSAVSAALLAAGLTQTTDTGQINWTTVTRPTAASTKAGYEIWRFNDTLQSTKPIFFKLEYGSSGNASGQNPATWLTVGTTSNGSGTVSGVGTSGVILAGSQGATASSNAAMPVGCSYSTSAGCVTILAGLSSQGTNQNPGFWHISRTCDSSGVPSGDGVIVYSTPTATSSVYSTASYTTATQYNAGTTGSPSSNLRGAAVFNTTGNNVYVYKNYALIPTPFGVNGALTITAGEIAYNSMFTASPFGTSHTYWVFSSTVSNSFNIQGSTANVPAFVWE